MRASLLTGLVLLSIASAPSVSALNCVHHVVAGDAWGTQRCAVRTLLPSYAPPSAPPLDAPPEEYPRFGKDWIDYHLYWALCTSTNPPRVEFGSNCGPQKLLEEKLLP